MKYILSFSCFSDSSCVLLARALFNRIKSLDCTSNCELVSVETAQLEGVAKEDLYLVLFDSKSYVSVPNLTNCKEVQIALESVAKLDLDQDVQKTLDIATHPLVDYIDLSSAYLAYYDSSSKCIKDCTTVFKSDIGDLSDCKFSSGTLGYIMSKFNDDSVLGNLSTMSDELESKTATERDKKATADLISACQDASLLLNLFALNSKTRKRLTSIVLSFLRR